MSDRFPYTHHGPAVYGSKLADYLISEANMRDDLKPLLAAVWPTGPAPNPPDVPHERILGCDGCDQRDAELTALCAERDRLREALRELADKYTEIVLDDSAPRSLFDDALSAARAALGDPTA